MMSTIGGLKQVSYRTVFWSGLLGRIALGLIYVTLLGLLLGIAIHARAEILNEGKIVQKVEQEVAEGGLHGGLWLLISCLGGAVVGFLLCAVVPLAVGGVFTVVRAGEIGRGEGGKYLTPGTWVLGPASIREKCAHTFPQQSTSRVTLGGMKLDYAYEIDADSVGFQNWLRSFPGNVWKYVDPKIMKLLKDLKTTHAPALYESQAEVEFNRLASELAEEGISIKLTGFLYTERSRGAENQS